MPRSQRSAAEGAWEDQAEWYDARQGTAGDRHHREVVIPAVLRQLDLRGGERVLDCCCGQGVVARALVAQGAQIIGIDAAPSLVAAARERAGPQEDYQVGDAAHLDEHCPPASVDHAVLVLALQDLRQPETVLAGIARALRPGGRLVAVLTHPCFRVPGGSDWSWDQEREAFVRRIDRYLQPFTRSIRQGTRGQVCNEHQHRPLGQWISAFGAAGLPVLAAEEPTSPKRGSPGKRAAAQDAAAREFPVFLVLVGGKPA